MTCRILGSEFDSIQLLFGYHLRPKRLMQALNIHTFWIRYHVLADFISGRFPVSGYSEHDTIRTRLRRNET